jgi:hypothetical protein
MKSVREPSRSTQKSKGRSSVIGKVVTVGFCVVAVCFLVFEVRSYIHGGTAGDPSTEMYIDAETGQVFSHRNEIGQAVPVMTPAGNQAGYPAVPCYWTKTGEIKTDPTWVLMNTWVGKPGPTFCPDCGRRVDPQAPVPPEPGTKPPPTKEELLHRK